MRFLLTNLLQGPVTHSDQVARFVQDIHIHDKVLFTGSEAKLLKTHWMYHAAFPFAEFARGAVYLVRHPADVLESALNYSFLQGRRYDPDMATNEREALARAWVKDYIDRGGRKIWIDGHAGTWAQNVESWTGGNLPFSCLTIRYEDLRVAPIKNLELICSQLGIDKPAEDLSRAVYNARIETMAALEEAEIASDRPGFFNNDALKGKQLGFRQIRSDVANRVCITPDERARIVAQNSALCLRFGYIV